MTLQEYIINFRRGDPLEAKEIVITMKELLNALEHIHLNKVIHRDFNPRNVFVCFNEYEVDY
jgi:serine/threonine protein kinase